MSGATKYPGIEKSPINNGHSYKVRFRDGAGKQRARNFRTLAEARDFKAKVDRQRRSGALPAFEAAKVTFAEYASQWASRKRHRPKSVARRDGILRNHLLPVLGERRLDQIRHSDLQDLVDHWSGDGLSPYSVRNHVNVLRPIFERAVRDDLLVKNPALGLELPKVQKTEPRALTPEECAALLSAIGPDYSPLVEIMLATGMRWSEVAALDIGDFDRGAKTLRVRESKTDAGIRTISIDDGDATLISKHLLAVGRSGADSDSPLFVSPAGHRLRYDNFRRRVFNPACSRAGLVDVTPHSLRRTHATMLIAEGHNAKAVQQRMGHASIQTTLTYYAAATEQERAAAAGAAAAYMAKSGASGQVASREVG